MSNGIDGPGGPAVTAPIEPGTAEAALATAYRLALHDALCRPSCPDREGCSWRWIAHTPLQAWRDAVAHLRPGRASSHAQARLVLHDACCASGCTGAARVLHARTQAVPVRVLAKVLRG